MKAWSDNEWQAFFDKNKKAPEQRDKWFTRRVMNRLPRKRWSAEMWVTAIVTVAVIIVCISLYALLVQEMIAETCWTCISTWGTYGTLVLVTVLATGQLSSFLYRLYKAS